MQRHFFRLTLISLFLFVGCFMNDANHEAAAEAGNGPRDTETIRRDGNHLKDEPSLYLQQHAHNPIDWYPWGPEALELAKAGNKPIFLSIGYSSCHWCHVMEHEVFEHDDVAVYMNNHFVCIKVDREERPDLDRVYMEAVQMMTGRGGWPMSVFLTPDLKPFYGATYIPHDPFLQLAQRIHQVFLEQPDQLARQASDVAARIGALARTQPGEGEGPDHAAIDAVTARAPESYDATHGGFRQDQKFPTPVKWRFLLHEYRRRPTEDLGRMIVHSLEAMSQGGLYDHVGGGFHRYTVDVDWTVPHFEKMLYDNGQLTGLFIEAGVVLDRPDFLATGTDALDFLLRDMRDPGGAFYSSYDADSGGEEGTYYVWNRAEINAVAEPDDGPVLAEVLGVTETGNFEHTGSSVLTVRADNAAIAARHGRSEAEVAGLLTKYRDQLRDVRDQRVAPGLDRKIITSWNGLVLASLCQGYAATGNTDYLDAARKAADFLLDSHRRQDGSLRRASSEGRTSGEGIIDDYAFFSDGLMELWQVSGEVRYLTAARELMDVAVAEFGRDAGGFYMSRQGVDAPLGRTVDHFDSVIPSGNAVMLVNLVKLGSLTGVTDYHQTARDGLAAWSGLLDRAGLEMAWWFAAARRVNGPFYDVVITEGDGKDALMAALLRTLPVSAVVNLIPADGAGADLLAVAPALAGKKAVDGRATAYVCRFGTCQAPTQDPAVMLEQILEGWQP